MRKLSLVFFSSDTYDGTTVFENAFRKLGFDVDVSRVPFLDLAPTATERLAIVRRLVREKKRDSFVVYSPGTRELFLDDVDFTLCFSAYKDWFDAKKMRVIPHIWTPVKTPDDVEPIRWREKPPLRVGFMGSPYTSSRLTTVLLNSPRPVRNWFLRGSFLKFPELTYRVRDFNIPVLNTNTFARIETIGTLRERHPSFADVDLEIIERSGFSGLEEHLREYKQHLERATYVICPRGMENYSYRMYEALCFGRVPVIIDTDMVFPKEIDWDRLCLRVPYSSLDRIYELIRHDYHSRPVEDFAVRQNLAFGTMRELNTLRWVDDIALKISAMTA